MKHLIIIIILLLLLIILIIIHQYKDNYLILQFDNSLYSLKTYYSPSNCNYILLNHIHKINKTLHKSITTTSLTSINKKTKYIEDESIKTFYPGKNYEIYLQLLKENIHKYKKWNVVFTKVAYDKECFNINSCPLTPFCNLSFAQSIGAYNGNLIIYIFHYIYLLL